MQILTVLSVPQSPPGLIVPKLLLSQGALDMLTTYVNTPPSVEVSGFAYVSRLDSSTFYVASASDVFITQQTVTIGSAHVNGLAYALATDRAVQDGRVDELRVQWHSHPDQAYFSDTDMLSITNFGIAGAEWYIHLVTNRDGDIRARFDRYRPERFGAEMKVVLYRDSAEYLIERARADVEALVTIKPEPVVRQGITLVGSTRKDSAK